LNPYQPFFFVTAKHPYFVNEKCRGLLWEPSGPTRHAMANMGMLFRSDSTGMTVYHDRRRNEALALLAGRVDADSPRFYFKAYAKNPYFFNFTNLPDLQANRLRYVDNSRAVAEKNKEIRLHKRAVVSDRDSALMSSLWDDGVLTAKDLGSLPLCVIHIRPVGYKNSPYDAMGKVRTRSYRICFDQRRTYWKYYVFGPLATQKIFIEDADNQCGFNKMEASEVSSQGPSVAFISKTPIPLRQKPHHYFQLKLHGPHTDKVIIPKLPAAPVNILHREKRGSGTVYISEIFIHL
jgi:hypothetical protein